MAERRAVWHEQLAAEPVAALVFVDESGANTKMTRLRSRALGGQRLLARIPHGHYQTSTLISGVRLEGPGTVAGTLQVAVPRRGSRPSRTARLEVRLAPVVLTPPARIKLPP